MNSAMTNTSVSSFVKAFSRHYQSTNSVLSTLDKFSLHDILSLPIKRVCLRPSLNTLILFTVHFMSRLFIIDSSWLVIRKQSGFPSNSNWWKSAVLCSTSSLILWTMQWMQRFPMANYWKSESEWKVRSSRTDECSSSEVVCFASRRS